MIARNVASRCVKTAVATAARAASATVPQAPAAVTRRAFALEQVRQCSSSRFLSLADDDGEGRGRRRGGGEDGEEGGEGEEGEEGADGVEQDGDLQLEEDEMYRFCVPETEETDSQIMAEFMSNPIQWTPVRLARKYHMSKQHVEAIIAFQAEESGMSLDELRVEVDKKKAELLQQDAEAQEALKNAVARGDKKAIHTLEKRDRQSHREADEADHEKLTEEEELAVMGLDDERYRNPDFFFLSDAFNGLPPLTRRLGKQKATDKMYPEEALEIQRLASKNVITELKSFAKPTDVKGRWKVAVKDTSKIKTPLYVRTEDHKLRLATKEEVLPRSWVRRPAFFNGLN